MTHLRILLSTAVAGIALMSAVVLAQETATSDTTSTVVVDNSLAIDSATLTLTPTVDVAASDGTTILSYATNDGNLYSITVEATVWSFTTVSGNLADEYPVLTFTGATALGGATAVTNSGAELIGIGNAASVAAVDVATGIENMEGTVDVTLGASVTQKVVAGDYDTVLTYTLLATQ